MHAATGGWEWNTLMGQGRAHCPAIGTATGLVNKEPGAEQRRNRTSPHTLSDGTLVMVLLVSGSMLVVKAIR